jgi:hypothetical protein
MNSIIVKEIVYNILKFPLILIFIKTPLINILKKIFKYYRFKKKNIFQLILYTVFIREYFIKLKDKLKIRELTDSTLQDGEGVKWAIFYYKKHFKTLNKLKKKKIGTMSASEAHPLFEKIIYFIKKNNLANKKNTYIIQLGSSSGRDLDFFLKLFPKLNYISTDVNNEILNFQKSKYNYSNLKYFKCYAENIDECINNFDISKKNIILFSFGSLQYVSPYFLKVFFTKIRRYKKLNLFICDTVSLKFIYSAKKIISEHKANIAFSHRYDEYAKKAKLNIIENKVIAPYKINDKKYSDWGNSYLHLSTTE